MLSIMYSTSKILTFGSFSGTNYSYKVSMRLILWVTSILPPHYEKKLITSKLLHFTSLKSSARVMMPHNMQIMVSIAVPPSRRGGQYHRRWEERAEVWKSNLFLVRMATNQERLFLIKHRVNFYHVSHLIPRLTLWNRYHVYLTEEEMEAQNTKMF